jgi:diguanylate cyclase (GGDEF)-like protein
VGFTGFVSTEGRMKALNSNTPSPERDLAAQESMINRIAWTGGIAVTAVTVATLFLAMTTADGVWWHYALFSLLAGVPFAYALFSSFVMRKMEVKLFSRYRDKLMGQLTDLQEMVYRDELTGLFNRRHFYEVARMEVDKARISRQPLAVVLLDLDGLKLINDEYGHRVGDAVLSGLGKVIATHTRGNDVPARLGGDEFGIVMPSTDKRGAFALARRLWQALESAPMHEEGERALYVTVSIGLAGYPWGGESVEEMIQWADADMYANKVSRKVARDALPVEAGPTDLESAGGDDLLGSV